MGTVKGGRLSVALEEVPGHHCFALLDCGGYATEFHTDHYSEHPLCVSGALGDDGAVAAGLLAEITRIVLSLGALDRGSVDLLGRMKANMKRSPSFAVPMGALMG